ncbi:hypothetical protein Glove_283g46 [Diversispora epigaea]|uniref:Uncharacterized protein n=1 Tax=Diversispora epigaea TaxID=1348612 RepID=A0A397I5G1_9GLOM|nr:hypothetical protein Glove_283g46 [Diversispora epigaea]
MDFRCIIPSEFLLSLEGMGSGEWGELGRTRKHRQKLDRFPMYHTIGIFVISRADGYALESKKEDLGLGVCYNRFPMYHTIGIFVISRADGYASESKKEDLGLGVCYNG